MTDPTPKTFERSGLLMVISAPSGGGKSVVLERVLEAEPDLNYSVSVTTRPPRSGERDGEHYRFVDEDTFRQWVREDRFYEWAEVHGHLYGTRGDTVRDALESGRDVAMDIDVQGGLSVKQRCPDAVLVFLMPPSAATLEARLRGRASDSEEQIRLRLANACEEMSHWRRYDYALVNDNLEATVEAVRAILRAERHRTGRLRPA